MICSTIIPTIGRASLSRAVESVLRQDFDRNEFEVIVVNDSGSSLLPEDWMNSNQVTILHTNRHNRSVARNTGAAVARGKYLHFLDDDDWILPDAYKQLWKTANATQAGWICGGFALVDNEGQLIKEIYPPEHGNCFVQMIASEWLPLQSSWIDSKAFFEVGGFELLFSTSGQDVDLSRKIARYYEFSHSSAITAKIRFGDAGSTTEYGRQIFNSRLSREKNLDMPGAFNRLLTSARVSTDRAAYWHGRIIYYYLASVRWNLLQKRPTLAASRATHLLLALLISGAHLFSQSFWKGVFRPHHNLVRSSLGTIGDKMYQNTSWKNS
jgi:glycosyltransferase involved in cell wall biosynthesis